MKPNCIIFACDSGYLKTALFSALALLKIKNRIFDIVIYTDNLEHPAIQSNAIQDIQDIQFRLIPNLSFYEHLPQDIRLKQYTYWKINAISDASTYYEKILYLDTDLFIDISRLMDIFAIDFMNKPIAAIVDVHQSVKPSRQPTEYQKLNLHSSYFNGGVILVNAKVWIETQSSQRIETLCIEKSAYFDHHDQTLLNLAFLDNWLELSPIWNWQYSYRNNLLTEYICPILIHHAGSNKIWSPATGTIPKKYWQAFRDFQKEYPEWGPYDEMPFPPIGQSKKWIFKSLIKNLWYFSAIMRSVGRFPDPLIGIPHNK